MVTTTEQWAEAGNYFGDILPPRFYLFIHFSKFSQMAPRSPKDNFTVCQGTHVCCQEARTLNTGQFPAIKINDPLFEPNHEQNVLDCSSHFPKPKQCHRTCHQQTAEVFSKHDWWVSRTRRLVEIPGTCEKRRKKKKRNKAEVRQQWGIFTLTLESFLSLFLAFINPLVDLFFISFAQTVNILWRKIF